ncbi:hypothetical protein KY346_00755 [Candidatus Woesearchaeota archaeon]|nr:hypothetical protein [Candidatus Woesearchaeota archaeon]
MALYIGCSAEKSFIPEPVGGVSVGIGIYELVSEAEERQRTLEEIAEFEPNIEDIIYFHENNKERCYESLDRVFGISSGEFEKYWNSLSKKKKTFAQTSMPERCLGKGKKSVIIIFPNVFEQYGLNELKSIVNHHESVHALDHANGIRLCGEKILPSKVGDGMYLNMLELRAFHNQLKEIENGFRVSERFKDLLIRHYNFYFNKLLLWKFQGHKYATAAINETLFMPSKSLKTGKLYLMKRPQR